MRLALALLAPACTADPAPSSTAPPDPGPAAEPGAPTAPAADPAGAPLDATTCPDFNPLKNAYFGDLHTHTTYSYDAYTFLTRATPMDAYAFARGMAIQIAAGGSGGPVTQLDRPLDFAALTDPRSRQSALCGATNPQDSATCRPVIQEAWQAEQAAAAAALDPRHYALVLQTPTNRWSVFDCQRSPNTNPTDCAPGGKLSVQIAERAWTSPVWYLP